MFLLQNTVDVTTKQYKTSCLNKLRQYGIRLPNNLPYIRILSKSLFVKTKILLIAAQAAKFSALPESMRSKRRESLLLYVVVRKYGLLVRSFEFDKLSIL